VLLPSAPLTGFAASEAPKQPMCLGSRRYDLAAARLALPAADRSVVANADSVRSDLLQGRQELRSRTWLWSVIVIWMFLMISSRAGQTR
jgi:hypothetical protein